MSAHRWRIVGLSALCLAGALALSVAALAQGSAAVKEQRSNKAAKVEVIASGFERQVATKSAPAGQSYFVLETEWTNIHPKQKVRKDDLEGKQDRTMGVGGLMTGGKSEKKVEYVDADVAYLVPSFFDHAYLLADGASYALDPVTEKVGGRPRAQEGVHPAQAGRREEGPLRLPRPGERQEPRLPVLRLFLRPHPHPARGRPEARRRRRWDGAQGAGLAQGRIHRACRHRRRLQARLQGRGSSRGLALRGSQAQRQSLSKGNIVQVEPTEYIWLATKAGHIYYSAGGSTTDEGFIRFTPEFAQNQEVAFVVPAAEKEFSLGMRVENRVYALALNAPPSAGPTVEPKAVHKDGRTLEIMLFGARREKGLVILDLGIRSLVESGAEIQTDAQFILKAGGEDVAFDEEATAALAHRPPTPFTVPPRIVRPLRAGLRDRGGPGVALLPRL